MYTLIQFNRTALDVAKSQTTQNEDVIKLLEEKVNYIRILNCFSKYNMYIYHIFGSVYYHLITYANYYTYK